MIMKYGKLAGNNLSYSDLFGFSEAQLERPLGSLGTTLYNLLHPPSITQGKKRKKDEGKQSAPEKKPRYYRTEKQSGF